MRDISRSPCTTIFMQEAEMDKSKITITATEEHLPSADAADLSGAEALQSGTAFSADDLLRAIRNEKRTV